MRRTWVRRLPGVTLALSTGLTMAMVPLSLGVEPVYDTVLYGLMSLALSGSGTLVARKHPGNAVGWLLCATGLVSAVNELAEGYGRHPSLVGHVAAAWFAGWAWAWGAGALSPIFLLFPSGHLPSRRWPPVLGVAVTGLGLSSDVTAFRWRSCCTRRRRARWPPQSRRRLRWPWRWLGDEAGGIKARSPRYGSARRLRFRTQGQRDVPSRCRASDRQTEQVRQEAGRTCR